MAPGKKSLSEDPFVSTEKVMQTFRMSRELVIFLKGEANARGLDLTAHVVRYLEGLRTWFGLPVAAVALIETDRQALGMGRFEYLLHLLFQRSLALREQPPGFDGPNPNQGRKR